MLLGHHYYASLIRPPSQTHCRLQISSDHSAQQGLASESAAQPKTDAPTAEVNGIHLDDNKASLDAATSPSSSPSPASQVPDDGASESAAPDNMDSIVEGLLIAGLHTLDDDDLPMQTNEFYSKAVLGCKPAGTQSQLFSGSSFETFKQTRGCLLCRSSRPFVCILAPAFKHL
jgi:endoglucanase Acf2